MKKLLMVLGSLFLIVIAIVVWIGSSVVSSIDDNLNAKVEQSVFLQDGNVIINVPVQKEIGIKVENLDVCTPKSTDSFDINNQWYKIDISSVNSSKGCFNGSCEVSLTGDLISSSNSFSLLIKQSDGSCSWTEFASKDYLKTISYSATIEFTQQLLNLTELNSSKFDVKSNSSSGYSSWQIMGTKKVKFTYSKKPDMDILTVNGKRIAKIIF